MTARNYTSSAPATTLSGGITNVAASLTVASSSGYPTAPFVAIIDRDGAGEEAVLVTNVGGTTWTVTRGYDGTTALSHLSGVSVEHGVTAIEFREANTHVNASSDVHGVSGGLKSYIDTADAVHPALVSGVHGVTGNLKTYIDSGNTHASATTGVHGVTGSIETRLAATESTATSANSTATTHVALTSGVHGVTGNLKTYIDSGVAAQYCRVSRSTSVTMTSGAALSSIAMVDEGSDTNGWHDPGGANITPTKAGVYLVQGGGDWEVHDTGYRSMRLVAHNGSVVPLATDRRAAALGSFTEAVQQNLSAVFYADGVNDFFALQAAQYNPSGTGVHLDTAWLTVTRLGA